MEPSEVITQVQVATASLLPAPLAIALQMSSNEPSHLFAYASILIVFLNLGDLLLTFPMPFAQASSLPSRVSFWDPSPSVLTHI